MGAPQRHRSSIVMLRRLLTLETTCRLGLQPACFLLLAALLRNDRLSRGTIAVQASGSRGRAKLLQMILDRGAAARPPPHNYPSAHNLAVLQYVTEG